jgi:hypothetical protein
LAVQGVIAESIIGFKITWKSLGRGKQPKWNQNDQLIEIYETDVYPDLIYTSAYASPKYVKYTSGEQLNGLLMEINSIIDAKLGILKEAALPPGPDQPKQLASGDQPSRALQNTGKRELVKGSDIGRSLIAFPARGGEVDVIRDAKPKANIDNSPKLLSGPEGTEEVTSTTTQAPNQESPKGNFEYTVIVHGEKLRFIDGQLEKGSYSSGISFLYKVSQNLTKVISGESVDNTKLIWAEAIVNGVSHKFKFEDFNVKSDEASGRLGGNLLVQVLPSVELSFTPDQNSVYSKEKPEIDFADVIKATGITLGNKTTPEIKALQNKLEAEIAARESGLRTRKTSKQSETITNK